MTALVIVVRSSDEGVNVFWIFLPSKSVRRRASQESEVRRLQARDSQPYPSNRKNPSASN